MDNNHIHPVSYIDCPSGTCQHIIHFSFKGKWGLKDSMMGEIGHRQSKHIPYSFALINQRNDLEFKILL